MYICLCNAVTVSQIEECARTGTNSMDALAEKLGVGTCCGRCRECAMGVLREAQDRKPALAAAA